MPTNWTVCETRCPRPAQRPNRTEVTALCVDQMNRLSFEGHIRRRRQLEKKYVKYGPLADGRSPQLKLTEIVHDPAAYFNVLLFIQSIAVD